MNFVIEWLSSFLSESFIVSFLRVFPVERVRRLVGISDTMSRRSVEIIKERKELLERGDEALKHEVGEGKDIMSILRALVPILSGSNWQLTMRLPS